MIVGRHDHLRNGLPFTYQDQAFCLDASCVHGRTLAGPPLPEFKIAAVPSRRDYWREIRQRDAQKRPFTQAASPRLSRPKGWDQTSEQILHKLSALAQVESCRILAELEKAPGFSESAPRQQAKAYAVVAGSEIPWSALLHQARNGEIHLDMYLRPLITLPLLSFSSVNYLKGDLP